MDQTTSKSIEKSLRRIAATLEKQTKPRNEVHVKIESDELIRQLKIETSRVRDTALIHMAYYNSPNSVSPACGAVNAGFTVSTNPDLVNCLRCKAQ